MIQAGRVVTATVFYVVLLVAASSSTFFEPFNVSYDHRALIIDGERRMLTSAGIHYPRATPEMWPDLLAKSKEGGADVIQSYVFWNGHEPQRGQYYFEGRYDLVKFVKLVGSSGMYFHLRIGPYVCAEWNFGGFPVWLRDIPGIEFRTDNAPFKEEMERFVRKIVDLMQEEMLFSWQGGPIIMLQIENEYGNIESSYGQGGKEYVKWAASMALGLDAKVPWIMCRQDDAPEAIINSCNAYYCDGFKPNSYGKPIFWTEDWDGWYASWGGRLPHRPAEDLAFAVARFFQRGGSFQNYYMFFGGTNFGRTSGGPFLITSYDYDAPIDEYGLLSQPKWGHLKDLHAAIKLCSRALVASDSPQYIKLGPMQEAHVYYVNNHLEGLNSTTYYTSESSCSAFLANIDEHRAVTVQFRGRAYTLPPWSVSILPDCVNVVFNTAKVSAQTSIKPIAAEFHLKFNLSLRPQAGKQNGLSDFAEPWMYSREPINVWSDQSFTVQGFLEHLNVTKDISDYLWHFTRVYVSDEDIAYWEEKDIRPTVTIDSIRDVLRVFVNGELSANTFGRWVKAVLPINLSKGYNDLVLLSQTVGLQNYGAFLERDGAGFRGQAKLTGFKNGDIDLTKLSWTYQVGLKGEFMKFYSGEGIADGEWTRVAEGDGKSAFTWYKNYFDSPEGDTPVALDLGSMGKGQAWVNGHHIGRYWTLVAPKDGCQDKCDYRGAYHSEKCQWNCGRPTQTRYHVPRSWLQESDNLLVIFEETGGKPSEISIELHTSEVICSQVSEVHYPPLSRWNLHDASTGAISVDDPTPEMHLQCENGHVISSVEFASYGTPTGNCQNFGKSSCHAPSSLQVVREACEGRNGCYVSVSNVRFGSDPCHGIVKTLAVQARCVPSSKGLSTASM